MDPDPFFPRFTFLLMSHQGTPESMGVVVVNLCRYGRNSDVKKNLTS